jgi:hypothetical protein
LFALAKRTRGSRRDRRRGARQASFAPPAPRTAVEPRAAADETAEFAPAAPAALPSSAPHSPSRVSRPSALALQAANEYRYVTLDLRRISVVVGALFAGMLVLWVAMDVLKVFTI